MNKIRKSNIFSTLGTDLFPALTLTGNEFEFEWVETSVGSNGEVQLLIETTGDRAIIPNFRDLSMSEERGFLRAYSSPGLATATRGEVLKQNNRRGSSPAPATLTATRVTGATYAPANFIPPTGVLFGAAGQGNRPASGDFLAESGFRILEGATSLLLVFTNESQAASYFKAYYKYYQVSPGLIPPAEEI